MTMFNLNYNQITSLKSSISKHLEKRYKDVTPLSCDNEQYLQLFEKNTKTVDDPLKTMFILPDGTFKRFEMDLSDFIIKDVYKINFSINNENLYNFINLDHTEIKYAGFDLMKILSLGCMRVSSDLEKKELDIGMDLAHYKPTKKMLKTIDEILPYCNILEVDFVYEQIGKTYQVGHDTIKELQKDINEIYNKLHQ